MCDLGTVGSCKYVLMARGWGEDEAMEVDGISSILVFLYPD